MQSLSQTYTNTAKPTQSLRHSHLVQYKDKLIKKIGRKLSKSSFTISTNLDAEALPQYPHGYYSSYISVRNCGQFDDELMWFISYFKSLAERNLSNMKDLVYEEIGNTMSEVEKKYQKASRRQLNAEFQRAWRKIQEKYTCGLDAIEKMEIYLSSLKRGTQELDRSYLQLGLKCQLHVFYHAVFSCEAYFQKYKKLLNSSANAFSVAYNQQIDEITISKTLKMLFCPICQIYDCGIHIDDSNTFGHSHHYVQTQSVFDYCSESCYKRIKNWSQLVRFKQRIKHRVLLTPLSRNLVDMGVHMYQYSPCMLWYLVDEKQHRINITCDLIFVYLVEEYNLFKRLSYKLQPSEASFLSKQKMSLVQEQIPVAICRKPKEIDANFYYNNKISICYHYFLDGTSIDAGCDHCGCKKRGYCRRQCLCSNNCPLKFGCSCKNASQCATNRCFCYQNSRECEPGICHNCFCFNGEIKVNKCRNHSVLDNQTCLLRIGKSKILGAGLGLFTVHPIKNKQFVCTYIGEIIDLSLQSIRQTLRQTNDFYNFGNHGGTIDSRFIGNKARFINHGNEGEDNIISEVKMCKGAHVIAFFAKRDILAGQQLFFNYDGSGQLFKIHKNKYPFIKKGH